MNEHFPYHFIPDLTEAIGESLREASADTDIKGRAIYRDSTVKVLLFPFGEGQVLKEHTTPHPAILHVIEGRGELTLGTDRKPVAKGAWAWMEGGLPHSVHAETKMVLLLQVFLNP